MRSQPLTFDEVLSRFVVASRNEESSVQAHCPAHEDRTPSLSITAANDGQILIHCHAGCSTEDVLSAVDLIWADVQPASDNGSSPATTRASQNGRRPEPEDFWNPVRQASLRADQQRLKHDPDHPLVRATQEWDGLDYETLVRFGCGIRSEHGKDWLVFPYETGAQLYRRDNGRKEVAALRGSKSKDSFFGACLVAGETEMMIAKSPREAMLAAQELAGIDVIGLAGGEKAKLSERQTAFLQELQPVLRAVRIVMDRDTDEAEETATAFAEAVAKVMAPVPVGLADVFEATQSQCKDLADCYREGGQDALATALANTEVISPDTDDQREPFPWRPFPTEALPAPASDVVRAQAAAMDCDEAFVALPVLAALAAGVGNSFYVEIKRSWREPSTIWTAVVADSGAKKSPPIAAAVEPVLAMQREASERHETEMELYEAKAIEEGKKEEPPQRRRYRVGDTTVETIALLHAENPRGLLLYRDELAGWIGSFDRYARGESDEQAWIEMYGGRPVTIDRKSAEKPALVIEAPNVAVTGGIQPEMLRDRLTANRLASGFGARLLLAAPPPRPRRWTDADVTHEVRDAYSHLVRSLYGFEMGRDGPAPLTLSATARDLFIGWVNQNGELIDSVAGGPLKAALSKIEALPARLALIFELAERARSFEAPTEVSPGAMDRAIQVAAWFRYETARLYQMFGITSAPSRNERLSSQLPEEFGWEDVARVWQIQKRGAHKVIKRITQAGFASQVHHGRYRRTLRPYGPYGPVDTGRWARR